MQQTNMERRNFAWFALADAEQCRLLCCRLTQQGTQHVEERGVLENTLPEHEHTRSMPQGGAKHDVEEKERRFAAETADWLTKKAAEHEMTRLVVFAPPRMLGLLRKASFSAINSHLEEVRGDLMGLKPGQLADHPLVRDLVRARQSR